MSKKETRISEQPTFIIRHSAPNIYDHAPQGAQCKVIESDGSMTLYVQSNSDGDNPRWELVGPFSE